MAVFHILKDGTKLNDISGHVVRVSDVPAIYDLLHSMNKKKEKKNGNKH